VRTTALSLVALLAACATAQAQEASAPPIYAQLLGGSALGLGVTFFNPFYVDATQPGYAVAAAIGVNVMDGLSVEADFLRTFRNEVAPEGDTYGTTSVMANVKYTAMLNETFGLYGAVGAGYIWIDNYDGPAPGQTYYFGGFGYQLIGGVSMAFTENLTGLLEARYQDSFHDYQVMGTDKVDIPTFSILGGLKLSF